MTNSRRLVFLALIAAGILWGITVPLSKVALGWMSPGWLAFARFALAAAILMVASRSRLRAACRPAILVTGGIGYGGSVLLQNFGIQRTSVSHAALLIGATPVLIAIMAAVLRHSMARPLAWAGFALSLAGVGFIAGGRGSGSSLSGDGLVLAAQLISAAFTVSQARLLRGRDPIAVTGLQLMAAAVAVLPVALLTEHHLAGPVSATALLATIGLVLAGTVLPTALFAFGQSRVSADVAGAFLNLEPLVGAMIGIVLFADPAGLVQMVGGAAVMTGIGLSSFQVVRDEHRRRARAQTQPAAVATHPVGFAGADLDAAVLDAVDAADLATAGPVAAGPAGPARARSRPPAGEAPSRVSRTRLPRPRPAGAPRQRRRRLGPAGRRPVRASRNRRTRRGRSRMP